MRRFFLACAGLVLCGLWIAAGVARAAADAPASTGLRASPAGQAAALTPADRVVADYCVRCHNDVAKRGGLTLEAFDPAHPELDAEVAEKMVRKLRAGMMPPPGSRRPDEATIARLAAALEARIDEAAARTPRPGSRPFQSLNRAEYERSIRDLLALDIDAAAYLPPDTMSAGFDNIADAQILSPTLIDGFLRAAEQVSRLAVGDARATPSDTTYEVSGYASQREHLEGAPFGTRGGVAVTHHFPADGEYVFRVSLHHESTGNLFGNGESAMHTAEAPEQLELSIDGERRDVLEIDRWGHRQDTDSVEMKTKPVFVPAGPHVIAAAFVRRFEGPVEDLMSPHDWTIVDKKIGYSYGITTVPHLQDLVINGPHRVTGLSDTPSRLKVFACRPSAPADERACAERIIRALASQAYRRDPTTADLTPLLAFYATGARAGGFESGIRTALQAILASPDFIFRFEALGAPAGPGVYRISDSDLASRLSFFLWASAPDAGLRDAAARGALATPAGLEAEVRRMLADPRAESLGTRFGAQWLRLQDLEKVHPDALAFPDYHDQLTRSMRRETTTFFNELVRADRSVLDILTADYTFVDERLARHYGFPDVLGDQFRRVAYPDASRRGVLGHASVLTLTSHANRTSPVLRGKWVMEVLLGTPPPPPPPDVPDLDDTMEAVDGRFLSTRERMEQHRLNPACSSCHRVIDPIGLALDNFDVTGRWRIRENGVPVDTSGELYDGTPVRSPSELRDALLRRSDVILTNFAENLLAYAVGRRTEHFDMPAVRTIVRQAAGGGHRMSAYILGVVGTDAFRMRRVGTVVEGGSDVSR